MKKFFVLALIFFSLAAVAASQVATPPMRAAGFFAIYPVLGGASSANTSVSVENRLVIIYTEDSGGYIGTIYGYGYVKGGVFVINPFRNQIITVGTTYKVAIPNDNPSDPSKGYGANPVDLTISGLGFEHLSQNLVLMQGAGPILPPGVTEPAPNIQLWFGNRLYQQALVDKGQQFVISERPDLKIEITIDNPYTLASDISEYSVVVDPESTSPQTLQILAANIAKTIYAAGTAPSENKISAMSLELAVEDDLTDGDHVFEVTARSSGLDGIASLASERATVSVLGGPPRLIGIPITFPSPFSKTKDGQVTIQYQLSTDTAIQIILVDISGKRIKNFMFDAGQEGGSAGLNKVTWDGVTDRGTYAGNGIYVGTIIAREDTRKLGTVKLTIVD